MKKCHCRQQDLNPGPCGCKSNIIPTQPQQLDSLCHMQKWFIYERLPQISFLVMKVVSYGLAQRILVIHGGLTREYPKYPLTQSVGRENLSGCHLAPRGLRPLGARWHPSRFSLPLSFVCGYSRISPFLTLSFREDLWILTRSPPSITLVKISSKCGQGGRG